MCIAMVAKAVDITLLRALAVALPIGAVSPKGWLRTVLQRQGAGLRRQKDQSPLLGEVS